MEPPVPIPNTEVKHPSADDTEGATLWENMPLPGGFLTCSFSCFIMGSDGGYETEGVAKGGKWLVDLRDFQSELAESLP